MKYIAIFLSVYIIVLSGMPCADLVKHNEKHRTELCKTASGNPQDAVDYCSPICSCQCCQVNFEVSGFQELPAVSCVSITYHDVIPSILDKNNSDFVIPPEA